MAGNTGAALALTTVSASNFPRQAGWVVKFDTSYRRVQGSHSRDPEYKAEKNKSCQGLTVYLALSGAHEQFVWVLLVETTCHSHDPC